MGDADFVEVGFVQKTHGVKGELLLVWHMAPPIGQEGIGSVFVEMDGIPTPFFIHSHRGKSAECTIVKFDDVDTPRQADELVGRRLMLPADLVAEDDNGMRLGDLVGYTITATSGQTVGLIVEYEEYSLNAIYHIKTPEGRKAIVPAADELIVALDEEARTVLMEIPEGLLSL